MELTKRLLSAGGQKPLPKRLGKKTRTKKGRNNVETTAAKATDKQKSRKQVREEKTLNKVGIFFFLLIRLAVTVNFKTITKKL